MSNIFVIILVSIGLAFELIGCIGLIRMPNVYNRLQAATKCVTIGTCFILTGLCVFAAADSNISLLLKTFACIIFILLTAPTAAHAIARAAHKSGIPLWKRSEVDKYEIDHEGEDPLPDDS